MARPQASTGDSPSSSTESPCGARRVREQAAGRDLAGHRQTASGRCTRAPPTLLTAAVLAALAPRPGSTPSTSTRVSASSPAPWPTRLGPGGRVDAVEGAEVAVRTPGATCTTCRGPPARGRRRALAARRAGAPGRPRRPRPAARRRRRGVVRRLVAAGAAGDRLRRLRPRRRSRATSVPSPIAATRSRLRAFDLFPMTHHVECVALLEPAVNPG